MARSWRRLERGGGNMDFIERVFGFSPDGGSGMVELLFFAGLIAALALTAWRWRRRASR